MEKTADEIMKEIAEYSKYLTMDELVPEDVWTRYMYGTCGKEDILPLAQAWYALKGKPNGLGKEDAVAYVLQDLHANDNGFDLTEEEYEDVIHGIMEDISIEREHPNEFVNGAWRVWNKIEDNPKDLKDYAEHLEKAKATYLFHLNSGDAYPIIWSENGTLEVAHDDGDIWMYLGKQETEVDLKETLQRMGERWSSGTALEKVNFRDLVKLYIRSVKENYKDTVLHRGKKFVYDSKSAVVTAYYEDDKNNSESIDGAGLKRENWEDYDTRMEYLDEFIEQMEEEAHYLMEEAKEEFGVKSAILKSNDAKEVKDRYNWVAAISGSDISSGVKLERLKNRTEIEVRQYIADLVKQSQENDPDQRMDIGTIYKEEVSSAQNGKELNGYAIYPDSHIDISVYRDDALGIDLEPAKAIVSENDNPEFIGQIIDIFEDFLEEKGIQIENPEKEQEPEGAAIIFGSDYGDLQTRLEDMMNQWGVTKERTGEMEEIETDRKETDYEIFRRIEKHYRIQDGQERVNLWDEAHDNYSEEDLQKIADAIDWESLVDDFEKLSDCNVAENETWNSIISDYFEEEIQLNHIEKVARYYPSLEKTEHYRQSHEPVSSETESGLAAGLRKAEEKMAADNGKSNGERNSKSEKERS